MSRTMPREVTIGYVRDHRTGGTHNVLEVCSKGQGVRFVMAQDSDDRIAELEARLEEHQRVHAENVMYAKELEAKLERLTAAAQGVVDAHDPQHTGSVEYRLKVALEDKS